MIGIGIVGCGYWGPNMVRNFSAQPNCSVRAICDLDPARLADLGGHFPAARQETDVRELFSSGDIDAVSICTPVGTHYTLARAALEAGKHVLVEKPMTDSVETSRALVELAHAKDLVLQVDHTFVYSGAVQKLKKVLDSGELGELLYIDCVRINLGLFQPDVNVVWDLAPHDVSVLSYLIGHEPLWVSAIGSAHLGQLESQAYVTIKYDDSLIAHLHVNWLAPVKIRSTLIGGSRRMIVYDDLAPSEKIRIYYKGVTLSDGTVHRYRALVDYRLGDMFAPHIDKTGPLKLVCAEFAGAIENGTTPLTDGKAGLEVVRILQAAQQSIRKDGERVPLELLG